MISGHLSRHPEITAHLSGVVQIFAIEVKPEGLPEDTWRMLDGVESYIASELDGLVYIPDEGIYDKELRHVLKLK